MFTLAEGDVSVLDGFQEKSAGNIVREVSEKRGVSLERFLYALGILHVGEETARVLARRVGEVKSISKVVKNIQNFSLEELQGIDDVGPKVAESIYSWFRDKRNLDLLERLEGVGVVIVNNESRIMNHELWPLSS